MATDWYVTAEMETLIPSDDSMLPGEIFYVPLLIVLDGFKSQDPNLQRSTETWMRCNLRSFFR